MEQLTSSAGTGRCRLPQSTPHPFARRGYQGSAAGPPRTADSRGARYHEPALAVADRIEAIPADDMIFAVSMAALRNQWFPPRFQEVSKVI
jgi:hypothetical protein